MTSTTPTAEFRETQAVAGQDRVVETENGIAGQVKPIVLSPQARERLEVLNRVLEDAGPSEAASSIPAIDGQGIDS